MTVQTSRFGELELRQEDILTFSEGLLGFGDLREFVLIDDLSDEIFIWLQSCENPDIAFPVLESELLSGVCDTTLSKSELQSLRVQESSGCRFFTIITIPDDLTQMTANLKAPIAINVKERLGRQCVLQDNKLQIREPIFALLQQRIVQNPVSSLKSKVLDWGVAVQLPANTNPNADVNAEV